MIPHSCKMQLKTTKSFYTTLYLLYLTLCTVIMVESSARAEPSLPIMLESSRSQCEPINVPLCGRMPYRSTRMPNFFHDADQLEASQRADYLAELIGTQCSKHLHAYVCELLTPVCLDKSQEAMARFEVYPCRSYCRRVRKDCEHHFGRLREASPSRAIVSSIMSMFNCSQLPYEFNGGTEAQQSGPCHESPEPEQQLSASQSQAADNEYRPYQPLLDTNQPPFITDTSRIDALFVRPPLPPPPQQQSAQQEHRQQQQQPSDNNMQPVLVQQQPIQQQPQQSTVSFATQALTIGNSVLNALSKNSNTLLVITLCVLLIALSVSHIRPVADWIGGRSGLSQPRNSVKDCKTALSKALSPSASSRSLMLIAGGDGKQPVHHLVPSVADSHKFLQALNRGTLIRADGTVEQGAPMQAGSMRYHQIAATDPRMHYFGGSLGSRSDSNHYDCIQLDDDLQQQQQHQQQQQQQYPEQYHTYHHQQQWQLQQQQQQHQMYGNILLSSPSHQVLLFGEQTSPARLAPATNALHANCLNGSSSAQHVHPPTATTSSMHVPLDHERHQQQQQHHARRPVAATRRNSNGSQSKRPLLGNGKHAARSSASCSSASSSASSSTRSPPDCAAPPPPPPLNGRHASQRWANR